MIVAATGVSAGSASADSSITFLSNPSEYISVPPEVRTLRVEQSPTIFQGAG
jgi:hypothetical protein